MVTQAASVSPCERPPFEGGPGCTTPGRFVHETAQRHRPPAHRHGPRASSARKLSAFVMGVLLIGLVCAGCSDEKREGNDDFHRARKHVTQGKYDVAIPLLKRYLSRQANNKNASRAGLFLGKAYLALGDIDTAYKAFETTSKDYPSTLESHKCRYKMALVNMLRGDDAEAIEQFGQLADNPDGPLAPEAKAMRDYLQNR